MASSVINKSSAADINTLNHKFPSNFCVKFIGGAGTNNTIYFPWLSNVSDSAEYIIFMYGIGAAQKRVCFIAYARKSAVASAVTSAVTSLTDVNVSISNDANGVYIKGISYTSGFIFSNYDITPSFITT